MSICKKRVLKQLGFYKTKELEITMPRLAVILDCKLGAKRQCEIFAQSARAVLAQKKNKRICAFLPSLTLCFHPHPQTIRLTVRARVLNLLKNTGCFAINCNPGLTAIEVYKLSWKLPQDVQ